MISCGEITCSCGQPFYFTYENGSNNEDRDDEILDECENCGCFLTIGIYYKLNGELKEFCLE